MRSYFLLIFLVLSSSAFGQSTNRKAQNSFDDAQQFVRQNIFGEAIKYLDNAIKIDPKFQQAYLQLGDIYKRVRNIQKAKENYRIAVSVAPVAHATTYFILGESELQTGDYLPAKQNFEVFLTKAGYLDEKYIEKTKKYILDCEFSINAIKNPVPYEPFNLGFNVNSEYRDYFPALTADGQTIIFTRNVKGNEDFYTSTKKNGEWQKAKSLSSNINTPNYNEGAQSISPDGRYLFFTGCNRPDGVGRCDLYVCRKEGNDWSKPINLGTTINTSEWESQPSISADGNTLYFLSNRAGGYGGYDVWKSTLDINGRWATPVNLGPNINTAYDEGTPFIHADGQTLFFSSDGWPGLGQKDIFYSKIQNDGTFSKAVNLGYPINTFNDEFGFIVSADGTEGLFSSDLDGGFGDVDIYKFKLPNQLKPAPITYVKGVVRDKDTNKPLEANVIVMNLNKKITTYNEITDSENGDFIAVTPTNNKYSFNVMADGYMLYSRHLDVKDQDANKPINLEILMEKIKAGSKVKLNNIFFDTNKFELLEQSIIELNLLTDLLKANTTVEVEIEGHTDDVGTLKDNQVLSQNRAKSVYTFLIENGIEKKRLTYKGYGETKPNADNATEEGRQLNRRTEFIITKI